VKAVFSGRYINTALISRLCLMVFDCEHFKSLVLHMSVTAVIAYNVLFVFAPEAALSAVRHSNATLMLHARY
jgi:hypothetical protein